jgi:RHS repeat-associated protein
MKSCLKILVLFTVVVVYSLRLWASVVENPSYLPITVRLNATVDSNGYVQFAISDAKSGNSHTFNITGASSTLTKTVWMFVGASYSITVQHANTSKFEIEFIPPLGFEPLVDGKRMQHFLNNSPLGASTTFDVAFIANGTAAVAAGELLTDNTLGSILFAFGLGRKVDGVPIGAVEIREKLEMLDDDPAELGMMSILRFTKSDDDEVYVARGTANALRQVRTYSVLLDIQEINGSTYDLRYYSSGQYNLTPNAYGLCDINGGATPFKTYRISVDATAKRLSVKEHFGGTGSGITEVEYLLEKDTVFYSGQNRNAWVLRDANGNFRYEKFQIATDATQKTETFRLRYLDPAASNSEIYVADVVYKTLEHNDFGQRVELIRKTEAPLGKAYTNFWTYYNGQWQDVDAHNYAKLWSPLDFRGNWSWTYYYDGNADESQGYKPGMPSHVMRPFADEYGDETFQNYVITNYRYATYTGSGDVGTDSPEKTQYYPAVVRTYRNTNQGDGPTLAKAHYKYSHESAPDQFELLKTVTTAYVSSDTADKLESTGFAYSSYLASSGALFRNKPFAHVAPDMTQKSFAYRRAKIHNPDFNNGSYTIGLTSPKGWQSVVIDGISYAQSGYTSISSVFSPPESLAIKPIYVAQNQSTMIVVTRDGLYEVVESYIYGQNGFELVSWSLSEFMPNGHVRQTVNSKGERVQTTLDAGKRIDSVTDASGVRTDFVYDNMGRVTEERRYGKQGTNHAFHSQVVKRTFDPLGRVVHEERYGVQPENPSWNTPINNEKLVSTWQYDLGGQLVAQTSPCGANIAYNWVLEGSTNAYYRKLETTREGHQTWTRWHRSGRVLEHGGDEMATTGYTYSVTASGAESGFITRKASISANHFGETTTDWLGRAVRLSESGPSGPINATLSYRPNGQSGAGQLAKQEVSGLNPLIFEYDVHGRLLREGIKNGSGSSLVLSSLDRIIEYGYQFDKDGNGVWWATASESIYPNANNTTKVQTGKVQERLNQFSGNMRYQTKVWNIGDPDPIWTTAWVDPGTKVATVLSSYPHIDYQSGGEPERIHSFDGMLYWAQSTDQQVRSYQYDHLRRLSEEEAGMDQWYRYSYKAGSSLPEKTEMYYQQPGAGSPDWVTMQQVVYIDGACGSGRVAKTIDADGRETHYRYNLRGLVTAVFGTTVPTVVYDYDSLGRQTTQYTFATAPSTSIFGNASDPYTPSSGLSSKKTTWSYYPWGDALEKKTYPDGKFAKWEYNAHGQPRYYQPPRLSGSQKIENVYNAFGELTEVLYPSGYGMTNLAYGYGRHGGLTTVTDSLGTRTFEYHSQFLQPAREYFAANPQNNYCGLELEYGYDVHGRPDAFTVGNMLQTVNYNPITGRIEDIRAMVGGQTHVFGYAYEANAGAVNLVKSRPFGAPDAFERVTKWNRQRALPEFHRNLNPFDTTPGSTPSVNDYASYTFNYHAKLPRIASIAHTGRMFRAYGATGLSAGGYTTSFTYDSQDRLTLAESIVNGTAVSLQDRYFSATLDNSGNRKTSQEFTSSSTYQISYFGASNGTSGSGATGANFNDQYRHVTDNSRIMISGEAPNLAHYAVKVNGTAAERPGDGDYFHHILNSGSPTQNVAASANVEWASLSSPYTGDSTSAPYFIPKKEREQTFDDNGNLTDDGVFTYTWDLEDRLVKIEHTSSANPFRKEFRYDYQSRRVEEVYSTWNGSAWAEQYKRRYLYDGFTMVAELLVLPGGSMVVERNFVWGHEIADGGVGALLLVARHSGANTAAYYPGYDGRGNVTLLVDAADMSLAAEIEYGIWGEIVRATGKWRETPFLYGTKWSLDQGNTGAAHWPIGLYDYGLRMYSPRQGRFISRDPIGETGGVNLYQAFGGDPVNNSDYLGMNVINVGSIKWVDTPDYGRVPVETGVGSSSGSNWSISIVGGGWGIGSGPVSVGSSSGGGGAYSSGDKYTGQRIPYYPNTTWKDYPDYYGNNAVSSATRILGNNPTYRIPSVSMPPIAYINSGPSISNYQVTIGHGTLTVSSPIGSKLLTHSFDPNAHDYFMYNISEGIIYEHHSKEVIFSIHDSPTSGMSGYSGSSSSTPKPAAPTAPAAVPASPGAPVVGMGTDWKKTDFLGKVQEGAEVVYGETSAIYPQQLHGTSNIYDSKNWVKSSWDQLQEARSYIADISERNRVVHRKNMAGSKNQIERFIWWQSEMASEYANFHDLPSDVRHFFIRQEGVGVQQPWWAKGRKPWRSFGPFIKPGKGGDVPQGNRVYIDIYRGVP